VEPDGHTFVRSRREASNGAPRSTRDDGRPIASASRFPVDGWSLVPGRSGYPQPPGADVDSWITPLTAGRPAT